MIQLQNIGISFGGAWLFRNLQWHMPPGSRVGLVGPNGAGKTTLLKIVCRMITPEAGKVITPKRTSFGYLPQDGVVHRGRTLFEEAYSALEDIVELKEKMADIQQELETAQPDSQELDDLLKRVGHLEHRMQALEAYAAESRVHKILKGLGFAQSDIPLPVESFSGGWQMRIALAKLLLMHPDALLLDEPTNHLDIPTLEWLETFLESYQGSVVLVSHDRYFLDKVVSRITEIEHNMLTEYHGNYSYYLEEKQNRRHRLEYEQYRLQKEKKRIQRFVDRFRYKNTKAKAVQSRIKMLEKMKDVQIPKPSKTVHFRFPEAPRSGRIVFQAVDISKTYDNKQVFQGLNLILERGRRVALVGPNGAGKSTLCRVVSGREPPTSGTFRLGHNVVPDSFSQDIHHQLNPKNTVLQEVESDASTSQFPELRNLLGAFLFSGDDVDKKVEVLSGGEKSRLALAKILLRPSNFLVLDEPTNHLDRPGREVLLKALNTYSGTILVVSHDRYFLDGLVDEIWELDSGAIHQYSGNYSYYHQMRMQKLAPQQSETGKPESDAAEEKATPKSTVKKSKEQKRLEAQERQQQYRERKRIETQLNQIITDIEQREKRKKELETLLSSVEIYQDGDKTRDIMREYRHISQELPLLYEKWEMIEKKGAYQSPKFNDKTVDKKRGK
jgi:ATP-binding cassette subfamily F protein 3